MDATWQKILNSSFGCEDKKQRPSPPMWVGRDNKFKKPPTLRRRFTVDSHVPGSESVQKISKPPFPFVARMVSISSVSLQSSPLSLYLIWSSPRKMNGAGRQGLRSGAAGVHHQRQYSDNFLDSSSNGNRWLQSAGLQHLQSSSNQLPPLQVNLSLSSPFTSDFVFDRYA